jgi:hypothetical protein
MYEAECERRRKEWLKQGRRNCLHAETTPERTFGGVLTGYAVCTTCAERLRSMYIDGTPGGRRAARVPMECPLTITIKQWEIHGRLENLSMHGCCIAVPLFVEAGDAVQLCLQLPDVPQSLDVSRAMVRWRAEGRFGVQFVRLTDTEALRLEQFLSSLSSSVLLSGLIGCQK